MKIFCKIGWHAHRAVLILYCVFHSIRFKVNKVGIQWYPIFLSLNEPPTTHKYLPFLPHNAQQKGENVFYLSE